MLLQQFKFGPMITMQIGQFHNPNKSRLFFGTHAHLPPRKKISNILQISEGRIHSLTWVFLCLRAHPRESIFSRLLTKLLRNFAIRLVILCQWHGEFFWLNQ